MKEKRRALSLIVLALLWNIGLSALSVFLYIREAGFMSIPPTPGKYVTQIPSLFPISLGVTILSWCTFSIFIGYKRKKLFGLSIAVLMALTMGLPIGSVKAFTPPEYPKYLGVCLITDDSVFGPIHVGDPRDIGKVTLFWNYLYPFFQVYGYDIEIYWVVRWNCSVPTHLIDGNDDMIAFFSMLDTDLAPKNQTGAWLYGTWIAKSDKYQLGGIAYAPLIYEDGDTPTYSTS